jgi:PD-(D/E)XK nuclease superfamily
MTNAISTEPLVQTVLISNSELDTDQKCDFRAYLAHGEELQRQDLGEALSRGIYGHKLFEIYWKARLQGLNHQDSYNEMFKFHVNETMRLMQSEVTNVIEQVTAALEWFHTFGYVPIETEQVHNYALPGRFHHSKFGPYELVFCMTPDTVLEGTKAEHDKGSRIVVDYKFTGQFWNEAKRRLYRQLPVYKYFLNRRDSMGISRSLLLQLNTRSNRSAKADLFKPAWIPSNKHKEERFYDETIELMHRYAEKKLMPLSEWAQRATRTIYTENCTWCPFAEDLCPQLLEGSPVATTIKAFYRKNDYGYSL